MHKSSTPDLTGLSDSAFAELDRLLEAEGIAADADAITPRTVDGPAPMSFAQELLWMLDRATPGLTAYNLPVTRRFRGALDVQALERALETIVARHTVLRTRFADTDGHPVQLVDPAAPFSLKVIDLASLPANQRESEAERVVRERVRTSFDLANEHLFRATLVRMTDDDHILVLESHHIVVDGWSLGILFRELGEAYAAAKGGRAPALSPVPIQFGDFAAWQRDRLSGARLDELLTFWRAQLEGATEPLDLPTDRPRPTVPTFAGARQQVILPAETLAAIKRLAKEHDATPYMVLLAAYATVLHRYTGRENVLIGSGSAGRTRAETEGLIGYLNNTLVQRANFAGDPTFAALLRQVRASA
jgi:hypothetical protein